MVGTWFDKGYDRDDPSGLLRAWNEWLQNSRWELSILLFIVQLLTNSENIFIAIKYYVPR